LKKSEFKSVITQAFAQDSPVAVSPI